MRGSFLTGFGGRGQAEPSEVRQQLVDHDPRRHGRGAPAVDAPCGADHPAALRAAPVYSAAEEEIVVSRLQGLGYI